MLFGVELVEEFVSSIVASGKVKGASPLSAVLIAEPERGKTSVVLERPCENVIVISKGTAKGLELLLQSQPKATHVILSDLTYTSGMSSRTSKALFEFLKIMMEEGVRTIADPSGIRPYAGQRIGMLGCMTTRMAKDQRRWWWEHGLASRMIPFNYSYPEPLTLKIKAEIDRDHWGGWKPGAPLKLPQLPLEVKFPPAETKEVRRISDAKAVEFSALGIRLLLQLRTLMRAHALLRSKNWKAGATVTSAEIDFLKKIYSYIDWTRSSIL